MPGKALRLAVFIVLLMLAGGAAANKQVILEMGEQPDVRVDTRVDATFVAISAHLNNNTAIALLDTLDFETIAQRLQSPEERAGIAGKEIGEAERARENAEYLRAFSRGVLTRFAGGQWILQKSGLVKSPYQGYSAVAANYRVALGENMFFIEVRQLFDASGELKMLDFYNSITEVSVLEYWGNLIGLWDRHATAPQIVKPLRGLFDSIASGKPEAAYSYFESLPASLRENKFLIVAVIESAENIVESANRLRVLRAMDEKYLEGSQKLLLSYYVETQQVEKAKIALAGFSASAAADDWLRSYQAGIYLQLGDVPVAYRLYDEALDENPDSEDVYFNLLDHFISRRQFDDAMLVVNCLYSRFNVYLERDKLQKLAGYKEFLSYKPFNEWLANFEGS